MLYVTIATDNTGTIIRVYGPTDKGGANKIADGMNMLQTIDPPKKYTYTVHPLTPP